MYIAIQILVIMAVLFFIIYFSIYSFCFVKADVVDKDIYIEKRKSPNLLEPTVTFNFNISEFLIIYSLSLKYAYEKGRYFLPLHFNGSYLFKKKYALTYEFIFRRDTYGTFDNYNEYIFLLGIRYSLFSENLKGFYILSRLGYGYSSGNLNDYETKHKKPLYVCHVLGIEPEVGYSIHFYSNKINLDLGIGVLVLCPLKTKNEFELSTIGIVIHRIVPIINIGLGVCF